MFLPRESQGWGSLVGCRIWGRTESDMTSNLAAVAAAQAMYLEAILPGVQTGALGAGFVLCEAGAEKCPGRDAFACKYNTF